MLVCKDEKNKVVSLWVTHHTSEREIALALCRYTAQYTVAVYRSGGGDVLTLTQALLGNNC